MPIIKQYCKGAPVLRHSFTVDDQKDNTAWGSNLEATQELDRGFSYPPSTDTPTEFVGFYPSPQMPSFRDIDETIKRPTDDWSEKMSWNVIYPWMSSSTRTPRCETYTNNAGIRVIETCHRFSFYRPIGQAIDQDNDMNICQIHGGLSSPSFVINEGAGGFIWFRVWCDDTTPHQTRFHVQNFERGVWHNFTLFSRWVKGTNANVDGRHLLFINDKIARIYNRTGSAGSWVFTKGQIPKVTGTTGGIDTLNTDLLGDLPISVNEDGTDVDLLFFKGRTLSNAGNISSFQTKWGVYKSSLGKTYYNTDATINTLLGGGTPWEEAILVNPNDPLSDKYILPEVRTGVLHTSVALGVVGAGETHEFMFQQLNDGLNIDAGDRAIIASNPELSWFTLNEATDYNLTLTSSNETFGTVSREPASNPIAQNSSVTLTATLVGTGQFQGWYRGSVSFTNLISSANPYNLVMNQDETIIGHFIDGTPIPPEQPRKKWAKKRS